MTQKYERKDLSGSIYGFAGILLERIGRSSMCLEMKDRRRYSAGQIKSQRSRLNARSRGSLADEFDLLYYKNPGAYGVRYHFVIYGFSLTETEKARLAFLLGRALEADHLEPF